MRKYHPSRVAVLTVLDFPFKTEIVFQGPDIQTSQALTLS
jgi:hypothetical protein